MAKVAKKSKRLLPTGVCWCGCGREVGLGSFFAPGHDRIALFKVVKKHYESTAQFLAAHGEIPQ